jgi:hypothetical protein
MRIDSSGSLMVGQSSTTTPGTGNTTVGVSLRGADGAIHASRNGNRSIYANRSGTDGPIISVEKDGVEVGSIGVNGGTNLTIGTGSTGLIFNDNFDTIYGVNVSTNATLDGTIDLGYPTKRFKDLYLSGSAYVGDKVIHDGDTNTYVGFATDTVSLVTGGSGRLTANNLGVFIESALHEDYDALSGTTPNCDPNNGGAFSLTMTGNTTFTFGGTTSGYSAGFIIQLTGNGGTVTWPSSVDWAGGTAPDAPASGETDVLVFWTRDGGTTWYGALAIDAAA